MNNNLIRKLLNTYAILIIIVVFLLSITIGYVYTLNKNAVIESKKEQAELKIQENINKIESDLSRLSFELLSSQSKTNSMIDFFDKSYTDYFSQQINSEESYIFPKDIIKLYRKYEYIDKITILLDGHETVYHSSLKNMGGKKVYEGFDLPQQLRFSSSLSQFESYSRLGNIYINVDNDYFNDLIVKELSQTNIRLILLSEDDEVKFSYNIKDAHELLQHTEDKPFNYKRSDTSFMNGDRLVVVTAKKDLLLELLPMYTFVAFSGLLLIFLLLRILFKLFGRYEKQVNNILKSMNKIEEGEIHHRIPIKDKEAELLNISQTINETLDSMNRYVEEIYQLEIRQQDINLRALQSQINPHFLYNTLEFIRMYAVSEGVDELAEIVFTFSTLLRNNISLEKTITLKKELEFCEKYVYLHQMRYPDRIAYKFDVQEELEKFVLPKFTIQPLIENFFVHGVDYTSVENAISVEALIENGRIVIRVIDNGFGMSTNELKRLQNKINTSTFNISDNTSVGLLNVHERLKVYLEDYDYQMDLKHSKTGGLVVMISFEEEGINV